MAEIKISELTANGANLQGTDRIPTAVDDGLGGFVTRYVTGDEVIGAVSKTTVPVRNQSGSTIYKGSIVYISSATGNKLLISKSRANSESTSARTLGVVTADIANNTNGNVQTSGILTNLDTRSSATHPFTSVTLVEGDTLYLDPTTAGYITNIKPSAPNHLVYIGKVISASPTTGQILYQVQNGYELDEIHDVAITSVADNNILQYDSATSLWKNETLSTAGIQPTLSPAALTKVDDTNVTLTLGGTPSTALLQSASLTLGWTGTLADSRIASASTWNDKQSALVSGTNLKTVNSTSLLGSGDVAVQPTLVSGTNIKTINSTSLLGSGNITIGGSTGNVVATHIQTKPQSGFYYSTALTQGNLQLSAHTPNVFMPTAFIPAYNLTIDNFILQVTTLDLTGSAKVAIYSDLNGVPYTKLLESPAFSTSTIGTKTITGFTFTFNAGTTYWIALVTNSSTAVWRVLNSNALMLGPVIASSNSSQVYTCWYINATYSSLPTTLTTPTQSNLYHSSVPYISFKAV